MLLLFLSIYIKEEDPMLFSHLQNKARIQPQLHQLVNLSNVPTPVTSSTRKEISDAYTKLIAKLYQVNKFTAVKYGLQNVQQLYEAMELKQHNPQANGRAPIEFIHVAGTNGKGSVAYKLAQSLQASGYKTGLFVSPHIASFRERIQINGTMISEEEVVDTLPQIFNLSAQLRIPATFFEITTILALKVFEKEKVDCVVLETGLGGRLDATNIIDPSLSVITSIGLDHTKILGNTIEDIAREKAGIIKPYAPVVVGPQTPHELMEKKAKEVKAPFKAVLPSHTFLDDYDAENTAIAVESCKQLNRSAEEGHSNLFVHLEDENVQKALKSRPPCRFQVLHIVKPNSGEKKVSVVLDVAHNPPAFDQLVKKLKSTFPGRTFRFVCGFSADKDIQQVSQKLLTITDPSKIHFVKGSHPRFASQKEIERSLPSTFEMSNVSTDGQLPSITEGLSAAIKASKGPKENDVVVVCGSVFLMSEARSALGFNDPVDNDELQSVAGSHLKNSVDRQMLGGVSN